MTERILRVNQLIKEELDKILIKDLDFKKNIIITLTRVVTSKELLFSKIYVSVFPKSYTEEVFDDLKRQVYFIQQKLNKKLKMKPIPKIVFLPEKETERAGRIEELLEQLKKEKK